MEKIEKEVVALVKKENDLWDIKGLGELRILIPWDYYADIQKEDEKFLEEDKQQIKNFLDKLEMAEEILIFNEPEDLSYPDGVVLKTPSGVFCYDVYDAMKENTLEEFQYINTKKYGTTFMNKKDFVIFVQNACKNKKTSTTACNIFKGQRKYWVTFNN